MDDKFIKDIIENLSNYYEVNHIKISNSKQIDYWMEWADICWFEWCDELVIYGSGLELAKRKKIICRLHSYEAFTSFVEKVNWNTIDRVIFVAEYIKQNVLKKVNIDENRISVVSNGINIDKYKFKKKEPGFNIAYVGYINYKKGPMLLLHAFKAIYDFDNRYKLYIAGVFQDERYALYFEQMIKVFGLENNVFYQGWQNDLNTWLEDKNYILCTSVLESQNVSVMQAMAKGIKPLVHNFVGCENIYPAEYIWGEINEIINMLKKEEYNSKEYRDYIENEYSLEKQLKNIIKLIEEVVKEERIISKESYKVQ